MEDDNYEVGDLIRFNNEGKRTLKDIKWFDNIDMNAYHKIISTEYRKSSTGRRIILKIEGNDHTFHYSYADIVQKKNKLEDVIKSLEDLENKLKK